MNRYLCLFIHFHQIKYIECRHSVWLKLFRSGKDSLVEPSRYNWVFLMEVTADYSHLYRLLLYIIIFPYTECIESLNALLLSIERLPLCVERYIKKLLMTSSFRSYKYNGLDQLSSRQPTIFHYKNNIKARYQKFV